MNRCTCDTAPLLLPSGVRLTASRGTEIEVLKGVRVAVAHHFGCPVKVFQECAELVRAAGCLCHAIYLERYPAYPNDYISPEQGAPHYDECPQSLADMLAKRGGA